jgi:hypothetical protein
VRRDVDEALSLSLECEVSHCAAYFLFPVVMGCQVIRPPDTYTVSSMVKALFSAEGLFGFLFVLALACIVFRFAFYKPADKTQVSKVRLIALLVVSAFNLVVIYPLSESFLFGLETLMSLYGGCLLAYPLWQ